MTKKHRAGSIRTHKQAMNRKRAIAKAMARARGRKIANDSSRLGSISAVAAIAGGMISGVFPLVGVGSALIGAGASAYFFKKKVDAEHASLSRN